MIKTSLIVCSRNRSRQLGTMLSRLDLQGMQRFNVELILVDSASDDDTLSVMRDFAKSSGVRTHVCRAPQRGLGLARNVGIAEADGDLLCFTDDDCYMAIGYFDALLKAFGSGSYQYGMGEITHYDPLDDQRVACAKISRITVIPPHLVLPTGTIQGANMFFMREVFATVGPFRVDMGAGTPFPCEDIEMGLRASLAGFTGIMLPSVQVFHHHGRRRNSPEATATIESYDLGRGAYYADAIAKGVSDMWHLWQITSQVTAPFQLSKLQQLAREYRGAAEWLDHLVSRAGNEAFDTASSDHDRFERDYILPRQLSAAGRCSRA